MGDLHLGIVGLGHIARHQIDALKTTRGARLTAICDRDPAKRRLAPLGVPFFIDLDAFLGEAEVDVVVVSVPPAAHVQIARAALLADRHVLVEKPLATDLDAFDELVHLAARRRRLLVSALHAAFGREVLWLLDAFARGVGEKLGPVTGFSCRFYDPYVGADGRLAPGAEGLQGAWLDSAINALSVVGRFIDPALLRVEHAAMTRFPASSATELQGFAELSFPAKDGWPGRGIINTNWTLGVNAKATRFEFATSGAAILLDHSAEAVERTSGRAPDGGTVLAALADYVPRLTAHYVGLFQDLVARLRKKRSNIAWSRRLHALMLEAHGWRRQGGSDGGS